MDLNPLLDMGLFSAIMRGEAERAFEIMNDYNVPVEYRMGGKTLLMVAAQNDSVDIMRGLLERGADPNARGRDGETAIMLAAKYSTVAALTLLLSAGADVRARDYGGNTALFFAADGGSVENTKFLVDAGVDPSITNNSGESAMSIAASRKAVDVVDALTPGVFTNALRKDGGNIFNIDQKRKKTDAGKSRAL